VKCDYCGDEIKPAKVRYYTGGLRDVVKDTIAMPFTCHSCGGSFCVDHRLPENHDCTHIFDNPKFQIPDDLVLDIPMCDHDSDLLDRDACIVEKSRLNHMIRVLVKIIIVLVGLYAVYLYI